MSEERVFIKYEKAIEMIADGDHIHTFRSSSPGIMLGADWDRKSLLEKMKNYKIEPSGKMAAAMNHKIVLIDETGPLFIETRQIEEVKP